VKTALRSLFVWLLLLALPFQGIAAARMLACVERAAPAAATAMAHADAAPCPMHIAAADQHAGHEGQPDHPGHGGTSCPACCIGVAPAPAPLLPLALAPPDFIAVPFAAGHVTSTDPSLPERPPRTLSA
jgi:hypothetical protein